MMMLAMPVFAQEEGEPQNGNDAPSKSLYNYVLVARSYGDSIVLRWAPQNAGVWLLANHYGWNIYRLKTDAELAANPADTNVEVKLNAKPIRPLTLDEMKAKYDTTHIYVGVAAQALYIGKDLDAGRD